MATITLNRKNLEALSAFAKKHELKTFFLAKDQGAYVGATGGKFGTDDFEQCLFYFAGCNPKTNDDWYEEARYKFGGDDFGEQFDIDTIHKLVANPLTTKMVIRVGKNSISMNSWAKPKPNKLTEADEVTPPTPKAKAPATKKRGVGVIAMEAISKGKNNDEVIAAVKAELPNANPTKASVNWYRNKMKKSA